METTNLNPLPLRSSATIESSSEVAWELFPAAYGELKRLAALALRREWYAHTLQRTALVHEAFLRMFGNRQMRWETRSEFFSAASNQMRQILVEHARTRNAVKRWGKLDRVSLDAETSLETLPSERFLRISEALDGLRRIDRRAAQIVEMRFYGGFTYEEIGEFLGIGEKTVERNWAFARAWLRRALSE